MADPTELLESFPRSLSSGAPDPDDLRRRGDRRRTRHRAAGAIAVVVALAALATPLALNRSDEATPGPASVPDHGDRVSLAGQIPAAFPLMTGLPDWAAVSDESGDPVRLEACGHSIPGATEPVDVAQGTATRGSETYTRIALTFEDHATAQEWLQSTYELLSACRTEPGQGGATVKHDTTLGQGAAEPPVSVVTRVVDGEGTAGIEIDQFYVVGKAALITSYVSDRPEKSDAELSRVQADLARPVVAAVEHTWVGFGDQQGVFVDSSAEAATKLDGASAGFTAYIGSLADQLVDGADCEGAVAGVTVHYVVDDRWAFGAINQCGGYVALWGAGDDGEWTELIGTQEMWQCPALEEHDVPLGIVGPCYTP